MNCSLHAHFVMNALMPGAPSTRVTCQGNPGHLISSYLPHISSASCSLCACFAFQLPCFLFCRKKRKQGGRVTVNNAHLYIYIYIYIFLYIYIYTENIYIYTENIYILVIPCSPRFLAQPTICGSLINTVPGNSSSSPQGAPYLSLSTHHTYTSLRRQATLSRMRKSVHHVLVAGRFMFFCSSAAKHSLPHDSSSLNLPSLAAARPSPVARFPISSFPYTAPFPVRSPPHPNPSFACSAPPACNLFALVPALSPFLKLKRFLRDLGITGPSGEHLPYWDQISYTRFLFEFW